MFEKGEQVGVYQVIEKLGQGGMATVFKAYHPNLDRYVALKVLHPALKETEGFTDRFEREAKLVAKLDHPNIVAVYDYAEYKGNPYLVMRHIEGETLKTKLARGAFDNSLITHIVTSVGAGLGYAHQQGILHRDIKPSNIMLTADNKVYITDFGLARMAQVGESTLSRDMLIGTPQYLSPEQAKGEKIDTGSDIYSFGVVIYELLVGEVPYNADTPYAIIHDHIFTPLPIPRDLNPDLPEPLERFLLKALAKKREDRFRTVDEMVDGYISAIKTGEAPELVPSGSLTPVDLRRPVIEPVDRKQKGRRASRTRTNPSKGWALVGLTLLIILLTVGGIAFGRAITEEFDFVFGQQLDTSSQVFNHWNV